MSIPPKDSASRIWDISPRAMRAKLVNLNLEEGIKTPVPPGLGRDYVIFPGQSSKAIY